MTLALPRPPQDWGAGGIPVGGDSGPESTWESPGKAWPGSGEHLGAVGAVLREGGPGNRLASQGGLEPACSQLPFRAAFADLIHSKIVFFSDF